MFRSFLALSLVRGSRGHAGDEWFVDLGVRGGQHRPLVHRPRESGPSMRPGPTAPCSLAGLLAEFRPCFTAPTFQTFIGLVVGLIAQTRRRTVCGMLTGAGLDQVWHHRPRTPIVHQRPLGRVMQSDWPWG